VHCDGDVRLLLDFLIDAGVQGLQGFQPECGMILEEMSRDVPGTVNPRDFRPLAVTTELPVGNPEAIQARCARPFRSARGTLSVLFTSIHQPDVPLANIKAMYMREI